MKKIILMGVLSALLLSGCGNATIIDTNYTFEKAIIDGIGEVDVYRWCDYGDDDEVQITDTDGNVYLTHYNKVILIHEGK